MNLEEGYFGCQVNETLEVLQIFKIEKLCDGTSDCYLGSDENQKELKCSSKYPFFTFVIVSFTLSLLIVLTHNRKCSTQLHVYFNSLLDFKLELLFLKLNPKSLLIIEDKADDRKIQFLFIVVSDVDNCY